VFYGLGLFASALGGNILRKRLKFLSAYFQTQWHSRQPDFSP